MPDGGTDMHRFNRYFHHIRVLIIKCNKGWLEWGKADVDGWTKE